jgi:hypothetical protein
LNYTYLAGLVGSFVVGLFSKKNQWMLIFIFGGLLLANDIYSILSPLADQPIWFKVLIFATLPVQIWIGGILGMRTRRACAA